MEPNLHHFTTSPLHHFTTSPFHYFTTSLFHHFTISPLSLSSFPNCPRALHHIRITRLAFASGPVIERSKIQMRTGELKQNAHVKSVGVALLCSQGFDPLNDKHGNCPTLIFLYKPCRRDKAALHLICYEKNSLCTRVRVVHAACFTCRRAGACLRSHRRTRGLVAF